MESFSKRVILGLVSLTHCVVFHQGDDENLYASIHELRDRIEEISTQIQEEAAEITRASGGGLGLPVADRINNMQKLDAQFREKQEELQQLIQERGAR